MNKIYSSHLQRVEATVLKKYNAASMARYVEDKTYYGVVKYSFKDHEYQYRILSDVSQEVNVRKCSQVGVTEASVRKALALVNIIDPYTVGYTMPSKHEASKLMTTRIDPIIAASPELRDNLNSTNDNSEVKQFGSGSFLHLKGAATGNSAISTPCDHLIHDEVDFSDQEVLGQYFSRLTHSIHKRIDRFSTPTLPNFGIDKFFKESRRHFNMCKCHHCGHFFVPSYYDHVKIPGFTGDLREITKSTLIRIRWEEAVLICPKCGKEPSLQVGHREWVCENPTEKYVAAGIQVSPFDAPNIIVPSYLVKASTVYDRRQDFDNFNLGLPADDKEATLTKDDFEGLFVREQPGSGRINVMGIDVGGMYHFTIGSVDAYGDVLVHRREAVPMGRARKRYEELRSMYRVATSVIDSTPHAETVMALQQEDPNLWASVYVKLKSLVTHIPIDKEQVSEEGKEFVRQVNVNRSRAFDAYMEWLRSGHCQFVEQADNDELIAHHSSMKRVKTYDNESKELSYSWQKTDGIDHWHHSCLYMFIASKMRGAAQGLFQLPFGMLTGIKTQPAK